MRDTHFGALMRRYVYGHVPDGPLGLDDPIAMLDEAGAVTYFHGDGRGTIIALSSGSTGSIIDKFAHGPFGELDANSGGSAYKYTSRRIDEETGLYYYRNRYYHPEVGRFMSADPIGYGDGLNIYAYVGNDPMNNVDPTGLLGDCTGSRINKLKAGETCASGSSHAFSCVGDGCAGPFGGGGGAFSGGGSPGGNSSGSGGNNSSGSSGQCDADNGCTDEVVSTAPRINPPSFEFSSFLQNVAFAGPSNDVCDRIECIVVEGRKIPSKALHDAIEDILTFVLGANNKSFNGKTNNTDRANLILGTVVECGGKIFVSCSNTIPDTLVASGFVGRTNGSKVGGKERILGVPAIVLGIPPRRSFADTFPLNLGALSSLSARTGAPVFVVFTKGADYGKVFVVVPGLSAPVRFN